MDAQGSPLTLDKAMRVVYKCNGSDTEVRA